MKILHVIDSAEERDDCPLQQIMNGAEAWRRHGHERHLATLDPPSSPCLTQSALETFALGVDGLQILFNPFGFTPRLVPWLKKYARRYDAIIVEGLWNFASLGVWRALRGENTPYFINAHGMLDPDFDHAHRWNKQVRELYWRAIESRVLRDACATLFTCEEEKRRASAAFSPLGPRACVIGYGAQAPEFAPERQIPAFFARTSKVAGRFFGLYLGPISKKQGVDLLIDAFSLLAPSLPQLDLVIAGPGRPELIDTLRQRASAQGFGDRIHWPGELSGDAKWGALHAARFFVQPSHNENFAMSVAEALAAATPVLISDKVNIWREIVGDRAGLAIADTLSGLVEGLKAMTEMEPARHLEMAARARASFSARYDLDVVAMGFHDRLAQFCAESRARAIQPPPGAILSSPPI